MNYLILTEPDDMQAIVVHLALQSLGHSVRCLMTADQPSLQKNSVFISEARDGWQTIGPDDCFGGEQYDVVWWRRPRRPHVPKEQVHQEDYAFILRENIHFFDSLTYHLAPEAWWINPHEAARRANAKLLQLKMAKECGLSIPITLCSNDPFQIRQFVRKHRKDTVIYKPLCANFWFESNQVKISYTAQLTAKNLPQDASLQMTPGIFQKSIPKQYELRINALGDYLVSTKIDSQRRADTKIDWRAVEGDHLPVELYKLPAELEAKICIFMRRMGLVFGALDFIVTPEGDYVFLEVNEQGQFLWIEELNPKIPLLDMFIQFLTYGKRDFIWNPSSQKHSIAMYRSAMTSIYEQNIQKHICLNYKDTYQPMVTV
jgi:glutathione synthase/RimK-type ligase-like ATP-grasp enzyme